MALRHRTLVAVSLRPFLIVMWPFYSIPPVIKANTRTPKFEHQHFPSMPIFKDSNILLFYLGHRTGWPWMFLIFHQSFSPTRLASYYPPWGRSLHQLHHFQSWLVLLLAVNLEICNLVSSQIVDIINNWNSSTNRHWSCC